MAATSFHDEVWHFGNAILHRALILHCRRTLGERPFLDRFQQAFEEGAGHIDLEAMEIGDVRDFRDCVASLTALEPDEVVAELKVNYNPDRVHDRLCNLVAFLDRTLDHAA